MRFVGDYARTWEATGPAGRRFLSGGVVYLVRALGYSVAFPLYAKERGYDPAQIGLFLAAGQFALFAFGIPITMLGGRGFSRRLLTWGPLLAALGVAVILLAPAGAAALVVLGALLAGFGGATFWVLGDPLLAHTTPPEHRAKVYALKFFMVTFGVALGGGIGGWVPGILETAGLSALDALAGTLILLAALDLVQTAVFARIPAYETVGTGPRRDRTVESGPGRAPRNWLPWAVMIALAVPELGMALGHNSIRPFLSLFFTERYDLSPATTGTLLAAMGLLGGVGALATPAIAARLGNIPAIAALRVAGAAAITLWFVGLGLPPVLALMVVYYLAMDGTEAIFITEGMLRVPPSGRTWFSGIYAMAWSAAAAAASVVSGAIQERNDGRFGAAFLVGAGGYLFSVLWITAVYPRLPDLNAREAAVAPALAEAPAWEQA